MIQRLRFWLTVDRLGPDIPLTHFLLHFKGTARKLCSSKFQEFGEGAEFRPGAYAVCTKQIKIGARVVIRPQSMLFACPSTIDEECHITVEDDVLIGSGCHIYTSNHEFSNTKQPISTQGHSKVKPVIIERGCWIGANVIVLPGVTIGANSVVGAGSVVTRNVEPFSVYGGNPARLIKRIDS
jgi:serine acetyltransferase